MPFSFSRLADYFQAVAALGAANDPVRQGEIAELLGLMERVESAPVVPPIVPPIATPRPGLAESRTQATTPRGESSPAQARQSRQRRKPVSFTIAPVTTSTPQRPAWLDDDDLLDPPRDTSAPAAMPAPLLARRSSRAILSTAMATFTETNQIDLHALIDAEVNGRALQRIPRRIVPSLARGIQVIVDRGPSSLPFDSDQTLLVEQIRAVGGRETVSVVELDPSREFIAASADNEWDDYFARYRPLPRVAVVLVSDLGIARVPFEETATPDDWARFVGRLRAGGNPVVAFVPYGPRRWPPVLRRQLAMIQWDHRTTVQSVRRALRRNLR